MGHHHHRKTPKSHTLPSSPTHSSSSSDFEFTISLSPLKSSATNLCPADDLFYKGQLLPLHLSPRISMVRNLLLSSSSSSTSTARHSSDSHSSFSTDACDSSRPSSATTDDDDLNLQTKIFPSSSSSSCITKKPNKYFSSLSRFSSVFRKETKPQTTTTTTTGRVIPDIVTGSSVKRMSVTAKEVIRKYLKKAKPLYEKLSHRQAFHVPKMSSSSPTTTAAVTTETVEIIRNDSKSNDVISHSFSGNLRYPRSRRSCVSSCPSSMRSSPTHSGILCRKSVVKGGGGIYSSSSNSSMEELQSAIQGAIAHCKNSTTQNN